MTRTQFLLVGILHLAIACHADPDDPAGLSKELSDPVRREHAIYNLHRLYTGALAKNKGKREHPEVKRIADIIQEPLVRTFVDNPQDAANGKQILAIFEEMQDARTVPALVRALKWRPEVSEEHAISAARTLSKIEIPEGTRKDVISALGSAFDSITGSRSVDHRMRQSFVFALGSLQDKRANPILARIAVAETEKQNALINRMAFRELGRTADPEIIPALIQGLFFFAPNNPDIRMNDVATEALVRVGRPAFEPLVKVLKGEDEVANGLANRLLQTIVQRNPNAASGLTVAYLTSSEAVSALGALGLREGLEHILAETRNEEWYRKLNGALALTRLQSSPEDMPRIREAIERIYKDMPSDLDGVKARVQLIAAAKYTYDRGLLPFFLSEAGDSKSQPDVRLTAVQAYALLCDKKEASALRAFIRGEPPSVEGGYRENFSMNEPALAAAEECDEDLSCWARKLQHSDPLVVRKATHMIGRSGKGPAEGIGSLVALLSHAELGIRKDALFALDRTATRGNPDAVRRIEELRETEEGRAIWKQFSREALIVQARLRIRELG